ncbi:uncharacterized protein LOC109719282 [Ananas comosus]|uniref:Uncharacterized protein LOC109719282 n=1 Tax=Ananas comosus TaxID=4615 RepID=A0A6P5FYJ2_ANACO|nr:uncharacterized protein LOC109719282 [Ananas comosus]
MVSTRAKSGKKATTSGEGTSAHSAEKRKERPSKAKRAAMDLIVGRCYAVHLHTIMYVSELQKTAGRFQTAGPALRDVMSDEQMALLKTTPFFSYLDLPPIKQDLVLVDCLLSFWDEERRGIRIGETFLPFSPEKISILIGLPAEGEPIEWQSKSVKSSTLDKYFDGDYRHADRSKLRHILYSIAGQNGEEMAADFARIFILYVFATVLFPTSHYIVPKAIYRYIDDVHRIGEYAWGHAVCNYLVSSISRASPRVKHRNSGQERLAGYIDGCTIAFLSWAYEHIKGLGTSDGDKDVPRMRKWKGSKAYRSYEKLLTKLQSYTPAEVVPTFTYRPNDMSILKPTLRGSRPEQAAAPAATTAAGESSNNISSLLNQLEQALNKLQDRNKMLEGENAMLKEKNAKLEAQLSSASTAAAAEGGAEAGVDPHQGGQGAAVEESSQQRVDVGETVIRDIPSRIQRIKHRARKEKRMSPDFTPGERPLTRHYRRKQHHSLKIGGAEASEEASDTATGTIAEVLLEIKAEHGHSDSAKQAVEIDDIPVPDQEPGVIIERRRKYPGRDKIPKVEQDAIDFLISRPITKGPIWQDNTKGSDSPSVSGQVLNEYLFGGPTRDEVINVYFHIINKLDCCGVHKFSQPGIFLRTEVAMHVLNKMQEYGKNNPVTADFVKDVAFGSASIRHFLQKINTQTCNTCRYVLIPLHSNWHWHLLSIDLKERRFESWNSLWSHSGAQDAAQLLAKWFASYFEYILEIPVGAPDVIFHKECQQQGSIEVDCGM